MFTGGIGIQPVISLLRQSPGLNARWFLLGEGAMMDSGVDAAKQRLLRLLTIERFMPVMTPEQQRLFIDGHTDFPDETVRQWEQQLLHQESNLQTENSPARCNPPTPR